MPATPRDELIAAREVLHRAIDQLHGPEKTLALCAVSKVADALAALDSCDTCGSTGIVRCPECS